MAELDLNQLRAQERAKIPEDPYGTKGRGMGIDQVIDAREEGLTAGKAGLRLRVVTEFSITEYINQEPSLSEDGRKQLTGGKYRVVYQAGDYSVKHERVYFGRAERHWAFKCYKVQFLCSECWIVEPGHAPGCPAVSEP